MGRWLRSLVKNQKEETPLEKLEAVILQKIQKDLDKPTAAEKAATLIGWTNRFTYTLLMILIEKGLLSEYDKERMLAAARLEELSPVDAWGKVK